MPSWLYRHHVCGQILSKGAALQNSIQNSSPVTAHDLVLSSQSSTFMLFLASVWDPLAAAESAQAMGGLFYSKPMGVESSIRKPNVSFFEFLWPYHGKWSYKIDSTK